MAENKLKRLINEVQNHSIVFDSDINIEARENLFMLSLSMTELNTVSKESILHCLLQCEKSIKESSNSKSVFYCWFDDMAGQIRLSAVSKSKGYLPFRCLLKRQKMLLSIVEEPFKYLDENYFRKNIDELSIYVSD